LKKSASEWVVSLLEAVESPKILALELLGESLAQWMDKVVRDQFFAKDAEHVAVQILNAVNALHKARITHCDLKPENILCHEHHGTLKLKLADSGYAHVFKVVLLYLLLYLLLRGPQADARELGLCSRTGALRRCAAVREHTAQAAIFTTADSLLYLLLILTTTTNIIIIIIIMIIITTTIT
jgi:serine/threonine protein kinase